MMFCLTCGTPCTGPIDRAAWVPLVDTGTIRCWRDGEPITARGPDLVKYLTA